MVSVGTGVIVGNAIKTTTPVDIGSIKKICVYIGGGVIGNMIADKATEYATQKIDDTVETIGDFIKKDTVEEE